MLTSVSASADESIDVVGGAIGDGLARLAGAERIHECLADDPATLGMRHRLESIVRAELAVDVVEVVAQRLSGNAQLAGDRRRVVAFGEKFEYLALMVRQCFNGRLLGYLIRKCDDLARDFQHTIE